MLESAVQLTKFDFGSVDEFDSPGHEICKTHYNG